MLMPLSSRFHISLRHAPFDAVENLSYSIRIHAENCQFCALCHCLEANERSSARLDRLRHNLFVVGNVVWLLVRAELMARRRSRAADRRTDRTRGGSAEPQLIPKRRWLIRAREHKGRCQEDELPHRSKLTRCEAASNVHEPSASARHWHQTQSFSGEKSSDFERRQIIFIPHN